jgi:hypothetical protein
MNTQAQEIKKVAECFERAYREELVRQARVKAMNDALDYILAGA